MRQFTVAGLRGVACAAIAAFAVSACSGGGSSPVTSTPRATAAPGPAAKTAAVTLTIEWPAPKSKAIRRPAYLSASTKSVSLTIGAAAPVIVNNPNVAGSPLQTSQISVNADVGTDSVLFASYDGTNATGNLLGRVSSSIVVLIDTANMLTVTLDGQLAGIGITPLPNQPLLEGSLAAGYTLVGAQPETFNLVPLDADGNIIIAPGAIPALKLTSGGSAITVAATSVADQYQISAPAPTGFVNLTASGTDLNGNPVTKVFKADSLAAIYVTNGTRSPSGAAVNVYDENGNAIALPTTAFADIKTGTGISYVPATGSSPPALYVFDEFTNATNAFASGAAFAYDLAGNRISAITPTGITSGSSPDTPLYSSFAPALGSGTLIDTDRTAGAVSEYDRALNYLGCFACEAPTKTTFTSLINPADTYYDPAPPSGKPVYFITDTSGNTAISLQEYSADGKTLIGSASAGLEARGMSWDADDKLMIISTKVTGATALVDPYSIVEYDETLTSKTPMTGFLNNGLKSAEGVVYDPNNKQIYAADSTGKQVLVFTVAGAGVTASGGFTGLNQPMGIEYVP